MCLNVRSNTCLQPTTVVMLSRTAPWVLGPVNLRTPFNTFYQHSQRHGQGHTGLLLAFAYGRYQEVVLPLTFPHPQAPQSNTD